MSEAYRPERIPGDHKFIQSLIEENEAIAVDASDEELVSRREVARLACAERWPLIEEARNSYQYPSQAFYVFDRILNRRRLNAQLAAQAAED